LAQSSLSARKTSVELLERISTNGEYSSQVIQAELQKSNLSQKDRSLVLELVNGTLRWQGQLDWILLQYFHGNFEKSPHMLKRILEVSLYQMLIQNFFNLTILQFVSTNSITSRATFSGASSVL